MEKKSRRTFLRDAGLGGTVLAGFGLGAGSAAAESFSVDGITIAGVSGDWSTFRGDAARTGYTAASGPRAAPTAHRVHQSSPSIESNVAVAGGVAYFLQDGERPTLVAFDLETETTLWQTPLSPGSSPGVTVDDGTVYVVGGSLHVPKCVPVPPTLAAVDATDGAVLWEHEFAPVTASWPTVVDGETYVFADDELVALDAEGSVSWRTELADGTAPDRSSVPAVADGVVVVADADGLLALDATDGSQVWRCELRDASSPAIADGTVYVTERYAVAAFDLADGAEQWRTQGSPTTGFFRPTSAPAVGNGRVYVAMDEEYVEAFSTADGSSEWWSDRLGDVSLSVGADTVYAADSRHHDHESGVYALDAADGTLSWTYEPESTFALDTPVVCSGTLLFGGETLTVLADE